MGFQKKFIWGAATAAYQIEGGAGEDGMGLSVWDRFCKTPGKIQNGDNADIACDSYHLVDKDIALLKEIGVNAYRFSISWPRVIPEGTGSVNEKGLDYYDAIVDKLLEAGIQPFITLFHWDYPYALYRRGGWLNPESPHWFAEYTAAVAKRLSDRVDYWITQNEPQCYIYMGLMSGEHAPGLKLPVREVMAAAHNSMLAHGMAVKALRAAAGRPIQIGYAPTGYTGVPDTESEQDIEALRRAMYVITDKTDYNFTMLVDPVILGRYPETAFDVYGGDMPEIGPDDLKIMSEPIDFLGFNIYNGKTVRMGKDGKPHAVPRYPGFPLTGNGWPVTPETLYWGPKLLMERYRLPFYVTENGMADDDWIAEDGKIHDFKRIDFMDRYLRAYRRLADEGEDVRGYFHWSLLDNFEWACGYSHRFGLTYVDYRTRERTLKDSAYHYRDIIRSNGGSLSL